MQTKLTDNPKIDFANLALWFREKSRSVSTKGMQHQNVQEVVACLETCAEEIDDILGAYNKS